MIQIQQVSKSYGRKIAVDSLDLTIPSGEIFALLGPNGAGKTTTIKMLVGLLRPSSGAISICGHDVVHASRNSNQLLGYVPDEPYLYDKLSGREFLQFIADMYGLEREHGRRCMTREIANFELAPFVDDLTETYSHGMKQRLAFAAALLHEPAVLVLDEPMVGLDPRSARLVKDLLCAQAAAGRTIFMSTHSLAVAEEIAARIGIIDQGRMRFLGTLDQLRQRGSTQHLSLEQLYLELTSPEAVGAASPQTVEPRPVGGAS